MIIRLGSQCLKEPDAFPELADRILICQVVHVGLRYTSLDYLCFPELNQKRACLLVAAHASGVSVPGELPTRL